MDVALPQGADVVWMPTGIAQSAVVSAVFVVYDPFGAFRIAMSPEASSSTSDRVS